VTGEIDRATARCLRACLAAAGAGGPAEVVVEMAGLKFIDSANLGVLAGAHQDLATRGSSLVLANVPPSAMMIFRLSGLDQILTVRSASGSETGGGP
jgi:anti-sigma B factor antagonist